ncbi:hypothetical protein CLV24_11658 [Pontibacter ummariensis]|uniref:SpoIIAA-like n=1 Tax=Pontibacter ummariensis TaxID=1610492 RepID=A0A239I925_9BACT|nr:hypothetical protein [Pontibacter ummariensis]PRY09990.1 hypothetical protein CLV24_11658 [Pontibacter ummariensis]SNS89818.1 hypothetical protein SAMN06296052_11641 [Pontibacter ummariensis]
MLLNSLEFIKVFETDYLTLRYSAKEKLIWNEWRGDIPSPQLREAMLYASNFILEQNIELILADFTCMCAPTMQDQVWIAKHTAELLQHSRLRRVANLLAQDIFRQRAIENIYEKASQTPMPCETRDFVSEEDALIWLLSD